MIGVVLLRYNGDAGALHAAVSALLADEPPAPGSGGTTNGARTEAVPRPLIGDIVLVDNASTIDPFAVERVAAAFAHRAEDGGPLVRPLRRAANDGFAAGNNDGIRSLRPTCDLVLIHNDDAVMMPGSLRLLDQALRNGAPEVVSVAPKILIDGHAGLIDSAGMAVNRSGEAKNVGLGQLDLGQFDVGPQVGSNAGGPDAEGRTTAIPILGPCFALALVRRNAFDPDHVGPLHTDYFMYYEDVEWNWRAARLGMMSLLVPAAVAEHRMSSSSRSHGDGEEIQLHDAERAYELKHRCIERNLLLTGAELLPFGDAVRLWAHRWPRLVKGGITGRFPRASVLAALDAARRLPLTLVRRRRIARLATGDAHAPLRFWTAEPIYFDPVTYQVQRTWDALGAAARLAGATGLAAACGRHDRAAVLAAAHAELTGDRLRAVQRYVAEITDLRSETTNQRG